MDECCQDAFILETFDEKRAKKEEKLASLIVRIVHVRGLLYVGDVSVLSTVTQEALIDERALLRDRDLQTPTLHQILEVRTRPLGLELVAPS